jgi:sulfur relay (sulfurtransferase) DsrC/TusE family protein
MTPQDTLKLLEISANLTINIMQNGQQTDAELKEIFFDCVDMIYEKYKTLPTCEQELKNLDEKFATISEMHRIFSEKFANFERKLAALPQPRTSRRPV